MRRALCPCALVVPFSPLSKLVGSNRKAGVATQSQTAPDNGVAMEGGGAYRHRAIGVCNGSRRARPCRFHRGNGNGRSGTGLIPPRGL